MPNITTQEKLLAITNAKRLVDGESVIQITDIDFGAPEVYAGARSTKTTRVYLTPKPASVLTGRATVFYDRIDLATITSLMVVKGAAVMVADLLTQISNEMGITLTATDIVDAALPAGSTFTLTASATNLIYKGSTTVTYTT